MAEVKLTAAAASEVSCESGPEETDSAPTTRSFFVTAVVGVAVVLVAMLMAMLVRTEGHFAYVIDDAAIHLGMAETLVEHGTWGVEPGVYQSASSSPLWTVLLAGFGLLLPRSALTFVPLLMNLAAIAWLLRTLASRQTVFAPASRTFDRVAILVLVSVVMFLPGLAVVGMEHALHAALLLQALVLLEVVEVGDRPSRRMPLVLLLLFLAGSTRFETLFVGLGLGIGVLSLAHPRMAVNTTGGGPFARRLLRVAAIGTAAGLPVLLYGLVNLSFGQELFPNSIVAKTALGGETSGISIDVSDTLRNLATDPVVLVGVLLAMAYLLRAWFGGARRSVLVAVVVVVTAVCHSALATFGWFERYQAYLIVLIVYFLLRAAGELHGSAIFRAVPALVVASAVVLAPVKLELIRDTPLASDDTYRQRYQLGRFLDRYYDGQTVATGELGYVSWFHDGGLVDVLGLANHEVLEARAEGRDDQTFWDQLVRRSGARIVAVYPRSIFLDTPANWILVGQWRLPRRTVTAFEQTMQFWAPSVEDVDRIREEILAFRAELPDGIEVEIDPLVDLRKDIVASDPSPLSGG